MSEFGERLREERVNLCLSQSAFAKRLGIHRNTQIKYESGERYPDTNYLDAVQDIGVDLYYLQTGIKVENKDNYNIACGVLAHGVYRALGFALEDVEAATLELSKMVASEYASDSGDVWHTETVPRFVFDFLSRSPVLSKGKEIQQAVSVELLAAILQGMDDALSVLGQKIPSAKKAQAVAMLYRSFKASGKIDPAMIEEAVKLAVG